MKTFKKLISKNFSSLIFFSALFLIMIIIINISFGNINFSINDFYEIIFKGKSGVEANILFYSRIPRALSSVYSGCALAVAGCILQNVLSNPLSSPGIIGVNAGAGLGVAISVSLGFLSSWSISVFSFFGALISVLLISIFSKKANFSKSSVILGGVALNSIFNAFCEAITALDPDIAISNSEFRIGGFSSISFNKLVPPLIIISVSLFVLMLLLCELDILASGDDNAMSLGLNSKKYRLIFLILSSLLSGAAVSFSGLLGFVGLIIPHFVRRLVGNESRRLIPISAIWGAAFVCLCDFLSRVIFMPYEVPLGVLMALIGGPLFITILIKTRNSNHYA